MEALVDYEALVTGQFTVERKLNSRKRKDDEAVDNLVMFLLSPNNVRTYSWGTVEKTYLNMNILYYQSFNVRPQGQTYG